MPTPPLFNVKTCNLRNCNDFRHVNHPEAVADAVQRLWPIFKAIFDMLVLLIHFWHTFLCCTEYLNADFLSLKFLICSRSWDIRTMESLCRACKNAVSLLNHVILFLGPILGYWYVNVFIIVLVAQKLVSLFSPPEMVLSGIFTFHFIQLESCLIQCCQVYAEILYLTYIELWIITPQIWPCGHTDYLLVSCSITNPSFYSATNLCINFLPIICCMLFRSSWSKSPDNLAFC